MPFPRAVSFRINLRTLLIVLVLTVPLLVADMILVVDRTRAEFSAQAGDYLETLAVNGAQEVSRYVDEKIADLRITSLRSEVLELVRASNRSYGTRAQADVEGGLTRLDDQWNSAAAADSISRVVGNAVAISLRQQLKLAPGFTRIVVADRMGVTVAASHKPNFYYHGDQAWWTESFGDGHTGEIILTDAHWDATSHADCLAIAAPIVDFEAGRVIGVIRGYVNMAYLGAVAAESAPGGGSDALLVKRDGRVVAAADLAPGQKREASEILEITGKLDQSRSGYEEVRARGGGRAFLAFADLGLSRVYPEIDWVMLVRQGSGRAHAAIDSISIRALLSGLLGILLVAAVAVYFTTHQPDELDPLEALQDRAHLPSEMENDAQNS